MRHPDLLRLDFSIPALHAILMASFVALPLALVEQGALPKDEHWWVYLTALLIGFFGMIPFIIYGEKKRQMRRVLLGAVCALLLCELFFWWFGNGLWMLVVGMVAFFVAFNLLEASLPSLISKVAPAGGKGTAMGSTPPVSSSVPGWAASRRHALSAGRAGPGVRWLRGTLRTVVRDRLQHARASLSPACACRFRPAR